MFDSYDLLAIGLGSLTGLLLGELPAKQTNTQSKRALEALDFAI